MKLSMHNKSEVDLRVAQELKNNTDFIYETNQKLQSHDQGMIALSILIEKLVAQSGSDRKWLLVEFENLREDILNRTYDLNQRVGNLEKPISEFQQQLDDLHELVTKVYATKQSVTDCLGVLSNESSRLYGLISKNKNYFEEAVKQLYIHIQSQVTAVKNDLTPEIPEVDPIQKALDERFAILKVDLDGLKTEIARLKRTLSYDEKKFENIYTLIERLQRGES